MIGFLFCSIGVHVESVGKCTLKETDENLYCHFSFSKENVRNFHPSLIHFNGSIKDMLLLESIITNHLEIKLNNELVALQLDKTSIDQKFINLSYKTAKTSVIESVVIQNKGFILFKNNHASFDFWMHLRNKKRLFKLNSHCTIVKAKYQ